MTQESRLSESRKPTERSRPDRSALRPRTVASWSAPSFIVATRNMAARVSGAATGWGLVGGTHCSIRICSAGRHLALGEGQEQLLWARSEYEKRLSLSPVAR